MTDKEINAPSDEELASEIEVPTEWAEAQLAAGRLTLSAEQIDSIESGSRTLSLPADLVSPLLGKLERELPIEWIAPIEAVHLLAPSLGGDAAAKAAIAERLRDGKIVCTSVWLSQGADIGTLSSERPTVSKTEISSNHGLWVSHIHRRGGQTKLGFNFWDYSDDWERDIKRWNWRDGLFVTSRRSALAGEGAEELSKDPMRKLPTRMVASRVRFCREDIEKICPKTSDVNAEPDIRTTRRGRKKSDPWNAWFAEVLIYAKANGIDTTLGPKAFNDLINDRIGKRNSEQKWLDVTTVEKAIGEIMRRWDEAKNKGEI